jgi:hypothetical protein|tara:strand:- start:183 stop:725 length:543 start_codon:yes stop_codon:yes gene_type:complete
MNKILFKKYKNIISKNNLKTFNKVIEDRNFPLFLTIKSSTGKKCNPTFEHCVVRVKEFRESLDEINSSFYPLFKSIFETFCKKNKIKHSEIYRCSVNLTFNINEGKKKSHTHKDHPYPHKLLMIYLNECDPKSKTVYISPNKKIYKIDPKINTGVLCNGYDHYYYYPTYGYRLVLIYTFI